MFWQFIGDLEGFVGNKCGLGFSVRWRDMEWERSRVGDGGWSIAGGSSEPSGRDKRVWSKWGVDRFNIKRGSICFEFGP